jgi:hypothetical protein
MRNCCLRRGAASQRYESGVGGTSTVPVPSEVALEGHSQYLRIRRYDIPRIHSIKVLFYSVADPICLSRIPDPDPQHCFFYPEHTNFKGYRTMRVRMKF